MPFNGFTEFIELLKKKGELIEVNEYVDPVLEIAEITDRFSKSRDGGKALLFHNTGTDFPVLTNAMGSAARMALSLGFNSLSDISHYISSSVNQISSPKRSFKEKLSLLPDLYRFSSYFPSKARSNPPCQQVVFRKPDLGILPVLKTWPHDGGRFITLPIVITHHPENGNRNAGMYRMQVFDSQTTGMHWHRHKTGANHYSAWKKTGEKMPVAVILGGDPVYTYAATAPLPEDIDEFIFAGFLRRASVPFTQCLTQDIEVPSDADIVIEGYVDPHEDLKMEGPFGDHTGFYSLEDLYPVFHVTAITCRKNAVFPATLVGIPPQEDAWIAGATERIFQFPLKKSIVPEMKDMYIPAYGVAHNLTLISIKKTYPGQARKVMNSLWGAGQMMFNKILVVADESTDIRSEESLFRILGDLKVPEDLVFSEGPLDVLDHSAPVTGYGSKLGIDLSGKMEGETNRPPFFKPESLEETDESLPDDLIYRETNLKHEGELSILVLNISDQYRNAFSELEKLITASRNYRKYDVILVCDEGVDPQKPHIFLWYFLNNLDPARDFRFFQKPDKKILTLVNGRAKLPGKDDFHREWPEVVSMSTEIMNRVDGKWGSYGFQDFLESPSRYYSNLVKGNNATAFKNR